MIVPRRSALYIPGDKPRALAKAATVASDCLIFDWEDAVAPAAKAAARDRVLAALSAQDFGHRERVIRVNGLDTPWGGEDVGAVAAADCDAVLFPKIESPEQVLGVAAALADAGARPSLPIWLMAETPRAVLDIDAIAGAHPAVSVIVMGTSDLGWIYSTGCTSTWRMTAAWRRRAIRDGRWDSMAKPSSIPARSPPPTRPSASRRRLSGMPSGCWKPGKSPPPATRA
jgi:citrate lyase beta subunit